MVLLGGCHCIWDSHYLLCEKGKYRKETFEDCCFDDTILVPFLHFSCIFLWDQIPATGSGNVVDLRNILLCGGRSFSAEVYGRSVLQVQETKAQNSKTVQQLGLFDFIGEIVSSLSQRSADQRNRHERCWRSTTSRLDSSWLQSSLPQSLRPIKSGRYRLLPVR